MPKHTQPKGLSDNIRADFEEYLASGGTQADSRSIAAWLVRNKGYQAPRRTEIDWLAPLVARALRQEYELDAKGRKVRVNNAVPTSFELEDGTIEQQLLWVKTKDATPIQMRTAFQHRRNGILSDCKQLNTDIDSYNEFRNPGPEIQFSFNFSEDLMEMEESGDYDDL